MRPVSIEVRKSGDIAVIDIAGEMRIGQPTALLRKESKRLLDEGVRLFLIDMLDVPWLDSSGLGEVFACYKRAREVDGLVKLVLRGKAYTLFTITRLDKVFEIYGDTEAALASFRES